MRGPPFLCRFKCKVMYRCPFVSYVCESGIIFVVFLLFGGIYIKASLIKHLVVFPIFAHFECVDSGILFLYINYAASESISSNFRTSCRLHVSPVAFLFW